MSNLKKVNKDSQNCEYLLFILTYFIVYWLSKEFPAKVNIFKVRENEAVFIQEVK